MIPFLFGVDYPARAYFSIGPACSHCTFLPTNPSAIISIDLKIIIDFLWLHLVPSRDLAQ
jgi:hypothetical protein